VQKGVEKVALTKPSHFFVFDVLSVEQSRPHRNTQNLKIQNPVFTNKAIERHIVRLSLNVVDELCRETDA